jgi:hypothetical protein
MKRTTGTRKQRHSNHQTQWAAQWATASELAKRGYQVALTQGNHPMIDLMVLSPKGHSFLIDVKGLHLKNFWQIRQRPTTGSLYYALVLVPNGAPNRFFILTHAQVNQGIRKNLNAAVSRRQHQGLSGPSPVHRYGLDWTFALSYEDHWDSLPG